MSTKGLIIGAGLLGATLGIGSVAGPDLLAAGSEHLAAAAAERARVEASVYFAGCREARSAGVTPLHAGDPGYREGMDGDGDGIACEDY